MRRCGGSDCGGKLQSADAGAKKKLKKEISNACENMIKKILIKFLCVCVCALWLHAMCLPPTTLISYARPCSHFKPALDGPTALHSRLRMEGR